MRYLRLLRQRLRSLFRRRAVEDELARELSLHVEQLVRELMASGASEIEARRGARLAFGSPDLVTEQCRDTRGVGLVDDLLRDIKYAMRVLVRSPGFALTAVLSLALGFGANTAIFSVVDAVLLRSLPVRDPQELVFINATGTEGANGAPPYPCFEQFRREGTAFAAMSAFAADDLKVEVDGHVEQVFGQVVSGNYFDMLGVRPAAGRLLSQADENLAPPVAVIGYAYWQRRFGGAPDTVGKTLSFRNQAYTIVGVTPPEFWGLQPGRQVDLSLPITLERDQLSDAGSWWFDAVARLRPGVTVAQAAAQADTIYQRFSKDDGRAGAGVAAADAASRLRLREKYFDHIELQPASRGLDRLRSRFSTPLHVLTLVAVIVLLIACANLGNLLLVRGAVRQREFAIRLAAGAGTGRLARQLLTETLLLFALGSAAGIALAGFSLKAWKTFFAIGRNPVVLDVRVDWRMAAFALAITLATGILTALWPMWHAIKAAPHGAMKSGDLRLAAARPAGRMHRVLVSGQIALSLVLLVAAVLFVRTLINLRAVDLGFTPRGVLTMSINPVLQPDAAAAERPMFWRRTLDRIRALPRVRAASLSVLSPLSGRDTGHGVSIAGYRQRHDEDLIVHVNHVSEGYFGAYGIALVAGREFTAHDTDGAPRVAIINEAAARAYFAGRTPIGQTLRFGPDSEYEVVGVARDAKHLSLREVTPRFVYLPVWQPLEGLGRMTLAVASDEATARLAHTVAQEVLAVRSNTLVSDVIAVQDQIDATLVSERLLSILGAGFAALALGLAAVGLFGILSYAVTRRKAELGIRMALGAVPVQVAWTVFREVLLEVSFGLAIGLLLAIAMGRAAESLLFGVRAGDPANYLMSVAILALVACLAASVPTLHACSIDPSEALRRE